MQILPWRDFPFVKPDISFWPEHPTWSYLWILNCQQCISETCRAFKWFLLYCYLFFSIMDWIIFLNLGGSNRSTCSPRTWQNEKRSLWTILASCPGWEWKGKWKMKGLAVVSSLQHALGWKGRWQTGFVSPKAISELFFPAANSSEPFPAYGSINKPFKSDRNNLKLNGCTTVKGNAGNCLHGFSEFWNSHLWRRKKKKSITILSGVSLFCTTHEALIRIRVFPQKRLLILFAFWRRAKRGH